MKRIVIPILFAVTASASFASGLCPQIGELARTIMEGRQLGVSMSSMLERAEKYPPIRGMVRQIVMDAFERPKWSSESMRKEAAEEFGTKWELVCHRATEPKDNV